MELSSSYGWDCRIVSKDANSENYMVALFRLGIGFHRVCNSEEHLLQLT